MRFLLVIIFSFTFGSWFVHPSVDKTLVPKAHGQMVIDAAINSVQDSCIFSNDQLFLRRIAWVESHFGDNSSTFLDGHSGVFRIDQISFKKTKNASFYDSNKWQTFITAIQNKLFIKYTNLSYIGGDMLIPKYNALATRLYLEYIAEKTKTPIPMSLKDQATYWASNFNGARQNLNSQTFLNLVNQIPAVCHAAGADILFILDGSGSIGYSNFHTILKFVQQVVGQFNIGPHSYKFGVDVFSGSASSRIPFNGYANNVSKLVSQIGGISYPGDGTNTAEALEHAMKVSLNASSGQGSRSPILGYPKIGVVITDGESNDPRATKIAATTVKQNGLILFTVGIGNAFSSPSAFAEIKYIASAPKCMRLYLLKQFQQLVAGFTAELKAQACQTNAPIVPTQGTVKNSVNMNQYFYFKFQANATKGITFQVNMTTGSVNLYLSLTVRNPTEIQYDYVVSANVGQNGNIFIPPITFLSLTKDSEIGTLFMDEVIAAQIGASNNFTNATIPVYGSLKGTSSASNNFTLGISQGNTLPPTTPMPNTTAASSVASTKVSPGSGYTLSVFLEYFDNTAGGGMLMSAKQRCDPFWFTGFDKCDMAIVVCVEPTQTPKGLNSCSTSWVDLGQVTVNSNNATFGQQTGGWSNPMRFRWNVKWMGFQIKYLIQDVDKGSRQLIDQNICTLGSPVSMQGTVSCKNMRPNGYPTLFRIAYLKQ